MITLSSTLAEQENIDALCKDRKLMTNEYFKANAFYGNDYVMKKFANLPQFYALKCIIPHGVVFDETHLWQYEKEYPLPAVFSYPPYRDENYSLSSTKVVIPSASPFIYVQELLQNYEKPKRKGLIFFPLHSTHHITVSQDYDAIADTLFDLDDEFQPVTICLYWRDLNLGYDLPFRRRGFKVVSAGHIYDKFFLFRLYHLCSMHLYSASNGFGSSLFYSVKAGCSFFFLDVGNSKYIADSETLKRDHPPIPTGIKNKIMALFSTPKPIVTDEQIQFVDHILGAERKHSRAELLRLLVLLEILDKTGYFRKNSQNVWGSSYHFSPFLLRGFRFTRRLLKSRTPSPP